MVAATKAVISEGFDHTAIARDPLAAGGHHAPQLTAQRLELGDLCFHGGELFLGEAVGVLT